MKPLKLFFLLIGIAVVLSIAYYLISPLFIVVELDEPIPQTEITKEMVLDKDKMQDMFEPMEKKEAMPDMDKEMMSALFMPHAHEVAGKAKVLEANGKKILRFEDFDTVNGPDLYIYVATDTSATDFVDLGRIKATKGNVNYDLPDDLDLEKYNHVLVYCKLFGVLFSYAVI